MDAVNFADIFSSGDNKKNIKAIIARNRYGRQITEALIHYIYLRVKIEKEYAKELKKLSKFEFPRLEPVMSKALKDKDIKAGKSHSQLNNALDTLQVQTRNLADSQANYAHNLDKVILSAFKDSYNKQDCTKSKHKYRLDRGVDSVDFAKNSLKERNDKLHDLKKSEDSSKHDADINSNNNKARVDHQYAVNNTERAQDEVNDARRSLELKEKNLQEGIRRASEDIYHSETERMRISAESLEKLCKLMVDQAKNVATFAASINDLAHIDAPGELTDFAKKFSRKAKMIAGDGINANNLLRNGDEHVYSPRSGRAITCSEGYDDDLQVQIIN